MGEMLSLEIDQQFLANTRRLTGATSAPLSQGARVVAEAFRVWWTAQKARANYGEFVQALLRIGFGVVFTVGYVPWFDWSTQIWVLYFCWGFVALSFVLFAWIYRARESSDFTRFLWLAVDMGAPTILLGFTGERSAIAVFAYTWVAVGHGFRFGLRYLYVA